MATKAKATPQPTPSKSTAVAVWAEKLKARASTAAAAEARSTGGADVKRIEVQSARLMLAGQLVKEDHLDVVVVCSLAHNTYFTTTYDADNPSIPDCYAYSAYQSTDPEGTMKAHAEAPDPQGAAGGKCEGCEHNEYGTSSTGKGKACGNYRLLACYLADDLTAEAFDPVNSKAEMYAFKVSVTSVRNWANYVTALARDLEISPEGVVTRISVEPDKKTQHRVHFEEHGLIDFDEKLWDFVESAGKKSYDSLATVYRLTEREEAKPIKVSARIAEKLKPKVAAKRK